MEPTSTACYSSSKVLLLSYCKKMTSEIGAQKEQSQDDGQKDIILTAYHDKCSNLVEEINRLDNASLSFVVLANILQKIAQLVLDFTYVEECCLIDQDFMLQAAYERVSYIIETLSSVENLTVEAAPDNHPRDVLSPSVVECLHWRKGALMYMYCHTLNAQCSLDQLPSHFKQCLEHGAKHLVGMLSTRSSPRWLGDASVSLVDQPSAGSSGDKGDMLLSQGIYSDTHLLALMYLGEMCYWYAQLSQAASHSASGHTHQPDSSASVVSKIRTQSQDIRKANSLVGDRKESHPCSAPLSGAACSGAGLAPTAGEAQQLLPSTSRRDQTWDNNRKGLMLREGQGLDMLKIGQLCLENYVTAAKGPMSAGGWNTDRAEEILQFFENLTI